MERGKGRQAKKFKKEVLGCCRFLAHTPTVLPFLFSLIVSSCASCKCCPNICNLCLFPHQQLVFLHTWKPPYTKDNNAILKPFKNTLGDRSRESVEWFLTGGTPQTWEQFQLNSIILWTHTDTKRRPHNCCCVATIPLWRFSQILAWSDVTSGENQRKSVVSWPS